MHPTLSYHVHEEGDDIVGDLTLASAFEVTCWKNRRGDEHHAVGDLIVYVRGQMRKKDGEPSRRHRSLLVDVNVEQPQWLRDIIYDARKRLA